MKNIRDSYKTYKSQSSNPIPIKEYCKVANDYNKFIMASVHNGEEVRLPEGLGVISVKGKKIQLSYDEKGQIKGFAPDYKATRELWAVCPECKEKKQLVYHLNENTEGVRYKYLWKMSRVLVSNKSYYTMIFTRQNKRFLSSLITGGKEYYIEPIREHKNIQS